MSKYMEMGVREGICMYFLITGNFLKFGVSISSFYGK